MADNFSTDANGLAPSLTWAADDISGVKYQRVKVTYGSDGSSTDVDATHGLPVVVETLPALPAGTNALGTVGVTSLPAADRSTDTLAATLSSDGIATGSLANSNLTILTPKFATITASTSGATTIVAAVTSKKIRVLSWTLVCNAAVNAKWQSHVTPTDKTGLHYFAANGGISVPFSPIGHFETVAGEALDINLSGAVAVGGSLTYVEV